MDLLYNVRGVPISEINHDAEKVYGFLQRLPNKTRKYLKDIIKKEGL